MDALRVWRRRWILTVLLLLLALACTAAAAKKLPRSYQSQSNVVLLTSLNDSKANGGNPYLSFNSSLLTTADVIAYQLMDPRTALALANRGYSAAYTVVVEPNATGPVLLATVTGSNKSLVEHTLYGVTDEIGTKMSQLQQGIDAKNRISVLTLSVTPQPTASASKTARPLVVVLVFGLALALAIPLIVDGRAARRRIRHETASQAATPARADPLNTPSPVNWGAYDRGSAGSEDTRSSAGGRSAPPVSRTKVKVCPRPARTSLHSAPVQPSSRKVRPAAIEKPSASKVAKVTAVTATEAARDCARSRVSASAASRLALRATSQPVANRASRANNPTIPGPMIS